MGNVKLLSISLRITKHWQRHAFTERLEHHRELRPGSRAGTPADCTASSSLSRGLNVILHDHLPDDNAEKPPVFDVAPRTPKAPN